MASGFRIGATFDDLTAIEEILENMGKPVDPLWAYQPFRAVTRLYSGQVKGFGLPIAVWRWGALQNLHVEELREFLPTPTDQNLSTEIFISTPVLKLETGERVFKDFKGIMVWPQQEDKQNQYTVGFELQFNSLVEQSE